jgi:crossover junction endodeoxyribonuclease RuvC
MKSSTEVITILGIDPGYDRVGWAIGQVNKGQLNLLQFGSILTKKSEELVERYRQIDEELQKILNEFHPQEAAVETLFFSKNQKTAMHVSEARGVIISSLLRGNVQFFEYNPLQMKQAITGYGKAEKSAVDKMLRLQFHLGSEKILDDVMDAIGMMVTHAASRKMKNL